MPRNTILLGSRFLESFFCFAMGSENLSFKITLLLLLTKMDSNPGSMEIQEKIPKHALNVLDVKRVSQFLKEYTVQNGLQLLGRQPNYSTHGNKVVLLLPSDKSIWEPADIWEL